MYKCIAGKGFLFPQHIEEFVHDHCNKAGIRLKKKIPYPVLLDVGWSQKWVQPWFKIMRARIPNQPFCNVSLCVTWCYLIFVRQNENIFFTSFYNEHFPRKRLFYKYQVATHDSAGSGHQTDIKTHVSSTYIDFPRVYWLCMRWSASCVFHS